MYDNPRRSEVFATVSLNVENQSNNKSIATVNEFSEVRQLWQGAGTASVPTPSSRGRRSRMLGLRGEGSLVEGLPWQAGGGQHQCN